MDIRPARAFVVRNTITHERVSHEFETAEQGQEFIEQIKLAEGDTFEVIPVE